MTTPLTREQVQTLINVCITGNGLLHSRDSAMKELVAHDAALRQALSQQAQEINTQADQIASDTVRIIHVTKRAVELAGGGTSLENAIERLAQEIERLKKERTRYELDYYEVRRQFTTLQATLTEREVRIKELEDWQKIVLGSGTDQETVIRMAASEYTKTAVQCWKDKVEQLAKELDAARQDAARLREALGALMPIVEEWCLPEEEKDVASIEQAQAALKGA